MKQNRLIKLLAAGAVSALALSTSFAQTTTHETTTATTGTTAADTGVSATTTTTGGTGVSATTSTGGTSVGVSTSGSALDGTGTITTYTPGQDYITMSAASGGPSKYYYTKSTTVVDSAGAPVDWKLLRSDLPVRYSYVKEGDRMVISKITVQKPVAEITKETTTTTTTSHR